MRKDLAETLLARIMGWSDEEKASERARLESFASYKYDGYQQFSPGRRFIESLALWLNQFDAGEQRRVAYAFVRDRLLFVSANEMNHLVELTFPTLIRPLLLKDSAQVTGEDTSRVVSIMSTEEYRTRLRQTLVLGLSDGARTDWFRRANPGMSNEQVFHAYDVSDAKAGDMVSELKKDLAEILQRQPTDDEARFRYVVLLDDFSASGTSAIREDGEGGWKGKIGRIVEGLEKDDNLGSAIAPADVTVSIILYIASEQAIDHIESKIAQLNFSKGRITFDVVYRLGPDAQLDDERDKAMLDLIMEDRYFDSSVDDSHAAVGGTSKRLGYANGKLPLVLEHNTPNNSIYLLWAEDAQQVRGLFPRVSRHRKLQ